MWILLEPDYSQMESTAAPLIFIGIMIVVVTLGYFSMRSHIKKIDLPDEAGADSQVLEANDSTNGAEGASSEISELTKHADGSKAKADGPAQETDD